jgi:3-hydroxybutyryl-CoA dehydrogenase
MQVAIVGAGTMGADIAQAVALGGDAIILHDIDTPTLRQALGRISRGIDRGVTLGKIDPVIARRAKRVFTLCTDLSRCAAADLVIEAVPDDLEVKQTVLHALDDIVRPDAILATSTNVLSLTVLAAATRLPERVVGLHFFKPAAIMRLVEVVRGDLTRQDVVDGAVELAQRIHKTPVVVKDAPGLIVNRIAQAYFGEALGLLDEGGLDVPTVDRLMEAAGFPMGPFRLLDFVGVDSAFDVAQTLFEATYHTAPYRPHPRLRRMIDAGLTGRKNGRGFYSDG